MIKNNMGETPVIVAQKYAQVDCVSLLQGKGERSNLLCMCVYGTARFDDELV